MKKIFMLGALICLCCTSIQASVRLKDIAQFSGMRSNQLVGYGLVVGLVGTGDKAGSEFTIQSMANMLERVGVRVEKKALKVKNVAAVMVTAQMPASATPGAKLPVSVSSIGDASSLHGGMLLMTPSSAMARGMKAGAASRWTRSVSMALHTPGRWALALTAMRSAMSRSAEASTKVWQLPSPVMMQGTRAFSRTDCFSRRLPRGMSTSSASSCIRAMEASCPGTRRS